MLSVAGSCTDDMTTPLPPGRTAADVDEFVLQAALRGTPDDETERLLAAEFLLSPGDAALARDRSFGGLVRAAARIPENCPAQDKDPWRGRASSAAPAILRWSPASTPRMRPESNDGQEPSVLRRVIFDDTYATWR